MSGPYNGFAGGFDQPGTWGRNDSGNFFVRRIHGDKQSMVALGNQIAETLGLTYEVTEQFGTATLEIHYPWNYTADNAHTDMVVKWEFFAAGSEKDLLEAQVEVPSVIGTLSQAQVQALRCYLQNPPTTVKSMPDPSGAPGATISVDVLAPLTTAYFSGLPADPSGSTGNAANALAVYNLMMQGVRSHPIDQPSALN